MIRVTRAAVPRILQRKAREWADKLVAADTDVKRTLAERKYQHPQIKAALVDMFHGKCAYCQNEVVEVERI
jgi:hypothetical protein